MAVGRAAAARGGGRVATWSRVVGLGFLLLVLFVPLPAAWVIAFTALGLALFLAGALAWLLRSDGPWLRGRA